MFRRIQFRRAIEIDDGYGLDQVWSNHGVKVWGSFSPISDGERWRAGEVAAHITGRFVVRYSEFSAGLTPADRLLCDGREYDISGIKEVGRREAFEITAAARAD
jgi:SPP1 family predicted phage head-tail adaptor